MVQLGWVHSHHGLPQQPSAADLRQQVELQTCAPNAVMVVLKPSCSAQAWAIPRGIHADLRVEGVDSSYPATDSLEAVALHPRCSGPLVEVVIKGRLLDLAATCDACLGPEGVLDHTRVAGACNRAQVSVAATLSLHLHPAAGELAPDSGGDAEADTPSSRGGAEAAGEPSPLARGGAKPPPPVQRASSEPRTHEPKLPLARRLTRSMTTVEYPKHEPLKQQVRQIRRVASDSATLLVPEPARPSSIDYHNESMLMSFFRKLAAKQKGTLVLKNVLMKTPLPLGAQTIEQAHKSWAESMKSLKEKKKIQITKADRSDISSWKVDVPRPTDATSAAGR